MLRVYFDDELIDVEAYTELDNEYKLFTDTFKLGSVASNTFKLSVIKSAVSEQPNEVRIEDDNTTWNFIVDNIVEDDNFYAYTLTDKLVDFNFDYDASELINSKAELEEDCYLSDIWKDMCLQAGVEYDEDYIFENDIVVTWYDSRVQARKYLSYIAELQSGYAYITEDNKQSFKKQNRPSVKTIDADECSDLIIGEKKKITRVVYDSGAFKWEFGDETGDTLYLQSDNVFIVNEQIVENIYNNIKDFEFYIIDVPNAPMDSSVRAGDIITISDNGVMYPTIAQYTMSYAGCWVGGYKLSVNTKKQQETQVSRVADNVKSLQVDVNRLDNEFGIIAEEITKLTDFIRNVGMTGNYLRLEETAESNGAINKLSIKGFELMPLYPGMAYPSEYTYLGVLNFYTLIFDTVNTFNNNPHYIYVNSPIPLQKLGSVHDELLIEQNKVKVIQRIGYDFVNEQWSVLSTPITHELNDVLLPTFDGDTFVSVKYFDNLIYDAEYIVKNDLTSNFVTQLESSSQFKLTQDEISSKVSNNEFNSTVTQLADSIEAKVSNDEFNSTVTQLADSIEAKVSNDEFNSTVTQLANGISSKVSKGEIVSEINQSEEEVKIEAQKIKLEGLTTINNNFKVLLDGSIEANNGLFKGEVRVGNTKIVDKELGVLTSLFAPMKTTFDSSVMVGWQPDYGEGLELKLSPAIDFVVPENFVVVDAILYLYQYATNWYNYSGSSPINEGFSSTPNTKLKKVNSNTVALAMASAGRWYSGSIENTNVLGTSGITLGGSSPSPIIEEIPLSWITSGLNNFIIETDMAEPADTIVNDMYYYYYYKSQTMIAGGIQLIGYTK